MQEQKWISLSGLIFNIGFVRSAIAPLPIHIVHATLVQWFTEISHGPVWCQPKYASVEKILIE